MDGFNLDFTKIDTSEMLKNMPTQQINMPWLDEMRKEQEAMLIGIKPREQVLEEKLEPLISSNSAVVERLTDNYNELLKLNEAKQRELEEAQKEAKKSKRMNVTMLIVAIISMLVAIAAWVTPLLTGGAA